jgi:hypothetical protein
MTMNIVRLVNNHCLLKEDHVPWCLSGVAVPGRIPRFKHSFHSQIIYIMSMYVFICVENCGQKAMYFLTLSLRD